MLSAADYQAIRNLVFEYAYLLDHGQIDKMSLLFEQADVAFPAEIVRSDPARVAEMFKGFVRIYPCGTPRTRHCISNVIIEPASDHEALARSYVMVFQQTETLPLQPIIGGDYYDRFLKQENVWRFAERRIGNDLFGNLSAHGKYEFPGGGATKSD